MTDSGILLAHIASLFRFEASLSLPPFITTDKMALKETMKFRLYPRPQGSCLVGVFNVCHFENMLNHTTGIDIWTFKADIQLYLLIYLRQYV